MTEVDCIKLVCARNGSMDYEELVSHFRRNPFSNGVESVIEESESLVVVQLNGQKTVIAKSPVKLCRAQNCSGCGNLHLCKLFLLGECRFGRGRRGCRFCHDLYTEQNVRILQSHGLSLLDRRELCFLLLQGDNSLLPPVCHSYNNGTGVYGRCQEGENCKRLHICEKYLRGPCQCPRTHDFYEPHPLKTLQDRGVPQELLGYMKGVYTNIEALRHHQGKVRSPQKINSFKPPQQTSANTNFTHFSGQGAGASSSSREKTEICMYFVKATCKHGDKCMKEHSKLPYKWEVRNGTAWIAIANNEAIEKDYCDPAKTYSSGLDPVYFDTMTRGCYAVRRLSTVSSVVQPSFILTTNWLWYWEDEFGNWIQYASSSGGHNTASITSEELEQKFIQDNNAVVEFTAGSQSYTLNFQDMIQTNKRYSTKKLVRRRPEFVSATDAQTIRTSKRQINFKALPTHWDKALTRETGYERVQLQSTSSEYKEVQNLFSATMHGFSIQQIERIQNKALWEVFQWQKDVMKKNKGGRIVAEKQLFHGTDPKHIDAICLNNFDWRICGTHGTAYGKVRRSLLMDINGSYFARDAKYSHGYTGDTTTRCMFVCRILVGDYTVGNSSYVRPPSKDGGDTIFYDSCVNDFHNPSVFVVFEKHQIYPEIRMALETALKLVCDSSGSVDYDRLVEIFLSLPDSEDVAAVVENSDFFSVIERNGCKKVIVRTDLKLCRERECDSTCTDLHLCKFDLLGRCNSQRCNYGHRLESEHNSAILRERNLHGLSKDQLRILLLQSDSALLPHVCISYNKGSGEYGNCPHKQDCKRLHFCEKYIRGTCDGSTNCNRCHDFYEPHPKKTLHSKGVPNWLMGSLLLIYKNILALKDCSNARGEASARGKVGNVQSNKGNVPESIRRNAENVICLSFVKGFCKYGDKCWRVHFEMPYKWEVEMNEVWTDLPDNEAIERDYCDPNKTYSVGLNPVRFDTMTQGSNRVRRVSTESSVLEPNFILTTTWNWYWENEHRKWIHYASVREMHRLSSTNSEELEQNYQRFLRDSNNAVVKFAAGKQFYDLNFTDMKQRNEMSGTERMVRRRPQFLSAFDVQRARAGKKGGHPSSQKGIPGFWNKSAVPDSGFQRVPLSPSDKDYIKVQERFHKTMTDFGILSIERVQNKELWEDFQTKRERMRKANKDKKYAEGERLLFHGTKSMHVDAICNQNVDMRLSGANGTVYGQGSYFARDAKYSHDFTDRDGERSMFVCRVLVGQYTKGASSYRRPPTKDAIGTLYDSCVDDVREPTIFVVFDRPQVYPEFLITYEENKFSQSDRNFIHTFVCTVGHRLGQSATTEPTSLADDSKTASNKSQSASMISTSSSHEKFTITSGSTKTEPASPSLSTTTASNPLIAVLDTSVSQPKDLVSSNPLVDDTLASTKAPKPVIVAPKSDQLSQLQKAHDPKPLTQFSSSELPSKSAQDVAAAVEALVIADDQPASLKQNSASACTKPSPLGTQQHSRKSATLSSLDSDLADLGFVVLDSDATSVSAAYKSSLTGKTVHSECDKTPKSTMSSYTTNFTKPAPQDPDFTVYCEALASSLLELYNTSSPSTNSRSNSSGQTAYSQPSRPQKSEKNQKPDCVVQ
ncbi:hypothetical protein NFI96_017338 [Prochilodus magdalenae]|nr:hypothetical protein NFI96_017338 [Prochilodus magdalenae]